MAIPSGPCCQIRALVLHVYPDVIKAYHLQAACLLFVGLKLLLPDQESGFDFEREFGVARGLSAEN